MNPDRNAVAPSPPRADADAVWAGTPAKTGAYTFEGDSSFNPPCAQLRRGT